MLTETLETLDVPTSELVALTDAEMGALRMEVALTDKLVDIEQQRNAVIDDAHQLKETIKKSSKRARQVKFAIDCILQKEVAEWKAAETRTSEERDKRLASEKAVK